MIKGATAVLPKPYSRERGRSLGDDLIAKLGRTPSLCWLFCEEGPDMQELLAGVVEAVGTRNLVGCTTDGEVSSQGYSTGSAVLGGMASDDVRCVVAGVTRLSGGSESAGRMLAQKFPHDTHHVQLMSDGLTGNGCALLRGMSSIFSPQVTISGGAAGDSRQFKQTWQFLGDRVLTDSVVAAGFSGDFRVGTGVRSGWFPAGAPKTVTRASGNIVYELDGRPALTVYRGYLGPMANQLPAVGVQFPFGLLDKTERLGDQPVLRAPMGLDEAAGSVTFAGEIPQGSTISLTTGGGSTSLLGAVEEAARQAVDNIRPARPAMAFFYTCMARRILLGPKTKEEKERVERVVGPGVPIIGFYTYGEYCPFESGTDSKLHNETATVTVLA